MEQNGYVLDANKKIINVIRVDENTPLDLFNAVVEPNGYDLEMGWTYDNGVAKDEDGNVVDLAALAAQAEIDAEAARIAGLEAEIRTERNNKLATEVDPLVTNPLRWAELSTEKQAEWTQYRQDLLDITDQETFPESVTWPIIPE